LIISLTIAPDEISVNQQKICLCGKINTFDENVDYFGEK